MIIKPERVTDFVRNDFDAIPSEDLR